MDDQRIDQLSRFLASGRSRRGVVKAITGTLFGAAAFNRVTPRADAQVVCAAVDESCAEVECCDGLTCSGNICFDASCGIADDACEINDDCCTGFACAGGTCIDASCGIVGDTCEISDDCCFGYVCESNACISYTCNSAGQSCETDNCCDGLTCSDDLVCAVPDGEVTPTPTIPVTTLPSTGSGSGDVGSDTKWLGVVGAAAAIGGVLIARKSGNEATSD